MAEQGEAPTTWELMRGINDLKDTFRAQAGLYVVATSYDLSQRHSAEAMKTLSEGLAEEVSARRAAEKGAEVAHDLIKSEIADTAATIAKSRKQFWATAAGGALLIFLQLFLQPIGRALGLTP